MCAMKVVNGIPLIDVPLHHLKADGEDLSKKGGMVWAMANVLKDDLLAKSDDPEKGFLSDFEISGLLNALAFIASDICSTAEGLERIADSSAGGVIEN